MLYSLPINLHCISCNCMNNTGSQL